ncbi:S1C family serine protease [Clostridium sp.]|jgi:S1-C subfamily serine protease|uniref:S1C family serine protease n=1 Tax=Clostridium sp. TaxID=1506 RepID=UPI003EEC6B54
MKYILTIIMLFMLSGCGSTGIVNVSPGIYKIHNVDPSGMFGNNGADLPRKTLKEAQAYADSHDKVIEPISERKISMAPGRFASYDYTFKLFDKKEVELINAGIPISYEGFKKYIDENSNDTFEGIWEDDTGKYTFGLVKSFTNKRYSYQVFIIDTKYDNWEAGEVKINFSSLRANKITTAMYQMQNKKEIRVLGEAHDDYIKLSSRALKEDILLLKIYPLENEESNYKANGSGTAWAITEDGVFITNAHVVKNAKEINIGFKDMNPLPAKVLLLDKRMDIAILKVNTSKKYNPIPINFNKASNGSKILTLGYPLAFTLGDDIRITNGIISAQSGINKDISRYQITATVQHGNSGGPIIDNKANAIGIVVSKLNNNSTQAVNFAIKSSYIKVLLNQLNIKTIGVNKEDKSSSDIFEMHKKSVLPVWTFNN